MQRVLSPIHEDNKDKTQIKNTENQKQIYLTKMIQMMDYYDYKPDKIDDNIIKQSYDDNTTLDEFIPYRGLFGNPDNLWEELSLGPVLAVGWVV